MDEFIRSLDVPICRDLDREKSWCFDNYSKQINEALKFHCSKAAVSDYLKKQISQMMHQGYVVFGDTPFSTAVRNIYEAMEGVVNGDTGRGRLNNISNGVGFEVFHSHFGHSSCIVENWVNYARKTSLASQSYTCQGVYENLVASLSKSKKTGEWLVYSKFNNAIKFWCIWLHPVNKSTTDEQLIRLINQERTY